MIHIIVGVDPGKTTGVACLDLNGKLLLATHQLFAGDEWIIHTVSKVGIPVIVASDKPTRSIIIDKVNAAFNAHAFYPSKVIRVYEKRAMGEATKISNIHERDAYSAAQKAYNMYENKFRQIDREIRDSAEADKVKAKVVMRYSINEVLSNKVANRR
jgi:predicted RNase H-like nuclease (RuvC/YqgF family)